MAAGAELAGTRYSAFISYSHADAPFVRRLQRRLEAYRLPRRLRNERHQGGRLPPVFVDRAELASGPHLTQSVKDGIASSSHLIVVCSPSSAASSWVGREIRLFRELHGEAGILTALCRGETGASFHPDLIDAAVADAEGDVPIAADFRRGGDGERLALLKLIAPLAGVRLDELVQRDAHRQMRRVAAAAAASMGGVAFAGALAMMMFGAQTSARQEHNRGDQMVAFMIGDERARLKAVGKLDLLDALNREAFDYFKARGTGQLTDHDLALRAKLLQDMVEDDTARGDFASADLKAHQALATTASLLAARPNDAERVFDHAQSEYWLGFVRRRLGDDAGAAAGFSAYADLTRRLLVLAPANPDYKLERGYADSVLATLLLQRSLDTARAEPLFSAAQADFEAVAKLRPSDPDMQIQVEDGYAWLADVHRLSGDEAGAERLRLRQRALITRLLGSDHHNFELLGRLVGNDLALGRIATAQSDWRTAVSDLQRAHNEASDLVDQDPANMDNAQEVRAIELFEARAMMSAPVPERPPRPRIAALLGDCNADAGRPNHAELAAFCTILRARLLAQSGDVSGASALLAPLRSGNLLRGERLSERWLIDWRTELTS